MGIITGYADDATTTDNDKFLTVDSTGATKLTPASNVNKYLGDGWIISGDSWSFSSWNSTTKVGVINTNTGANTKYQVGMWVKFTQPTLGTKYGRITATATSSITVRFSDTTQLDNEAITNTFFSAAFAPFGASNTGAIDTRNLAGTCRFFSYRNAALNSASGAFVKIACDTELYDKGSNYDSTTNFRFVAPYPGEYLFGFGVGITNVQLTPSIYKNGTEFVRFTEETIAVSSTATIKVGVATLPMDLTTNDYIELWAYTNSISSYAVGNTPIKTFFWGKFNSV